jgi:DNA-binding Lrp family transcriptional regulator
MDDLDRSLIALLREDARTPVATLAERLGVARGTVQNRMRRLEAEGTIVGYTVRLRAQVEDQRIRAFMTIAVEGNRIDAVMKTLRGDLAVATLTQHERALGHRRRAARTRSSPSIACWRGSGWSRASPRARPASLDQLQALIEAYSDNSLPLRTTSRPRPAMRVPAGT